MGKKRLTERVLVLLSRETWTQLAQWAIEEDRPLSAMARVFIEKELQRRELQLEKEKASDV